MSLDQQTTLFQARCHLPIEDLPFIETLIGVQTRTVTSIGHGFVDAFEQLAHMSSAYPRWRCDETAVQFGWMKIDGVHDGGLRLTRVGDVRSPAAASPKSAPRIADGDTVLFEAVYISNLPRVPVTAAHRRLESLRRELVAARTDVPVHFNDPRIVRSANPYAAAETLALRFSPNPADANGAATERAT